MGQIRTTTRLWNKWRQTSQPISSDGQVLHDKIKIKNNKRRTHSSETESHANVASHTK